jgi:hypothetical protein
MQVDESSFTGETHPARKQTAQLQHDVDSSMHVTELKNIGSSINLLN